MTNVRIYEISRELKLSSKEVIKEAQELGIDVKSHSSTVNDEEAELIKESFQEQQEKTETSKDKKEEKAKKEKTVEDKKKPARPEKEAVVEDKKEEFREVSRTKIKINENMTVTDIAQTAGLDTDALIKSFKNNGIIVTANQRPPTAYTEKVLKADGIDIEIEGIFNEPQEIKRKDFRLRSPVVTVLGHVDHGKTQMLDTIRHTRVIAGESGGITQHIGAYKVSIPSKGDITFIDTPGHEAFTAMRARGANITDIVVLLVSGEDGVMPQTIEAINHGRAAGVPMVVAVNKMDLPGFNGQKTRTQLTQHGVITEELGGDVVSVDISAKEGTNIDELLEMILLQAEMLELKAPYDGPARGVVVESELDKWTGSTATVLVTEGVLRKGESFVCGLVPGKIKKMTDDRGKDLTEAVPSTPVKILGFEDLPHAGDKLAVVAERTQARDIAAARQERAKVEVAKKEEKFTLEDLKRQLSGDGVKELNLILKTDFTGSMEAIKDSFRSLDSQEVNLNVLHAGVGAVTQKDVMLADASGAVIIGFNVSTPGKVKKEAEREGIEVRSYRIIYEIIDDIKKAMEGLLEPEKEETVLGRADVKKTFNISGVGAIAGSMVSQGTIERNGQARIIRDSRIVYDGKIAALKRFKDDVAKVASGYECGINIANFNDVKAGDIIECYRVEERKRTLEETR